MNCLFVELCLCKLPLHLCCCQSCDCSTSRNTHTAVIYLTTHRSRAAVARTFTIEYITSDFIPIIKKTCKFKASLSTDTCAAPTPLDFTAHIPILFQYCFLCFILGLYELFSKLNTFHLRCKNLLVFANTSLLLHEDSLQ